MLTATKQRIDLTDHHASPLDEQIVSEERRDLRHGSAASPRDAAPVSRCRAKTFLLTCLATETPLEIRDPVQRRFIAIRGLLRSHHACRSPDRPHTLQFRSVIMKESVKTLVGTVDFRLGAAHAVPQECRRRRGLSPCARCGSARSAECRRPHVRAALPVLQPAFRVVPLRDLVDRLERGSSRITSWPSPSTTAIVTISRTRARCSKGCRCPRRSSSSPTGWAPTSCLVGPRTRASAPVDDVGRGAIVAPSAASRSARTPEPTSISGRSSPVRAAGEVLGARRELEQQLGAPSNCSRTRTAAGQHDRRRTGSWCERPGSAAAARASAASTPPERIRSVCARVPISSHQVLARTNSVSRSRSAESVLARLRRTINAAQHRKQLGADVVTIAATYVLTPFVIHTLGQEGYGTWTLITAMTGYISLLALGVPMASRALPGAGHRRRRHAKDATGRSGAASACI